MAKRVKSTLPRLIELEEHTAALWLQSRYALFGLLDYPSFTGDSTDYLRSAVRERVESGRLSEHEVIAAWEDDD